MDYRKIVGQIPPSKFEALSERLLDALLKAKEGGKVPSSLAKAMLSHAQRKQLASEAGLTSLLEALSVADPEAYAAIGSEFGLEGE
jgi:hypothetical protein